MALRSKGLIMYFGSDDVFLGAEPSSQELLEAMQLYNLPGRQYVGNLDDFRGDGLEGEGHDYAAMGDDEAMAFLGWDDGLEYDEFGWSPFKAIKSAVKSVAKVTGKVTSAVTNPLAKIASKIPVVGGVTSAALRAGGAIANPLAITNPKALVQSQLAVVKPALKLAKTVVKSPVVKTLVTGAAIVFPPVGLPAAAGLAAATAVAKGLESNIPVVRAAAQQVAKNTAALAKSGNQGASMALAQMVTAKGASIGSKLSTPAKGAKRLIFDVHPTGKISQVAV